MREIFDSNVGTSIEPPRIAVSNDMGASKYRSILFLSKILFGSTFITTYRSPFWPPEIALPSPDSLTLSPWSTPAGIVTESFLVD